MNTNETPVNLLIADSQGEGHFRLVKVVSEKNELIKVLERENISLLIIDHSLIDIGSISELKDIILRFPELKVLVLSNNISKPDLHDLNSAGIFDIILKTAGSEELFEAIDYTLKGKKYYSNELLDLLFEVNDKKSQGEETGQLTVTEIEIVRLISSGLTTKEIALRKFISFHTVISHRKNIFRKLGVTSISELIMYSIKAGWLNTIEYHI
jgi:DNA-binding NarL/FixJ family response regulator